MFTDQVGATTEFFYDDRDQLTRRTDPLGRDTTFTYDAAGRLTARTDRNGDTVTFAYTPTGDPDTISYPDDTSVQLDYDARGNVELMTDVLGESAYEYDALDRLVRQTDPHGFSVEYGYDEAGNLTSLTYPGDKTVTYTYDALNRLATVTPWTGGTASLQYDDAGRLTHITHLNGSTTDYSYDDANRLVGLENQRGGGSTITAQSFVLDANGNRIQEERQQPEAAGLMRTAVVDYSYNAERNRLLAGDGITYSYDLEGQLQDRSGTPFEFDFEHRLIQAGTSQYFYDGAGNRLKATRDGETTFYVYDAAGNLLAEADESQNITRYYLYGAGLMALVQGGQAYTYHFSAAGHTLAVTDGNETIQNQYAYSPYGLVLGKQETIPQPFQYVGQRGVHTEPNGLYYMRARYYDPATGRFISEDPKGLDAGVNLYAYVGGNPINFIDPAGLDRQGIGGGSAFQEFALGFVPGYDLAQAINNPNATGLDYAIGIAGLLPVTKTLGLVGKGIKAGRAGRQARLRELADDPKISSADRGWIRQEMNQIERGTRRNIRNPPGKQLAHPRGREAAKGFSHTSAPSQLQDITLHRLQHKYDPGLFTVGHKTALIC